MNKPSALGAKIAHLSQVMAGEAVSEMPLALIDLDPAQPRKTMDPDKLQALAASIKAQGVLQPIVVRRNGPNSYLVVFGERRFRASQLAGNGTIRAIVREVDDETLRAARLIENMHREDVDPIEEAQAIQEFIDFLGGGHGAAKMAADSLGVSESTVSQRLALLKLPDPIKAAVEAGHIKDADAAITLGKVHAADPAAAAALLAKAAGEGVTRDEVRQANKDAKAKKKAAKKPGAGESGTERCDKTPDLLTGQTDAEKNPVFSDNRKDSADDLSSMCQNPPSEEQLLNALGRVFDQIGEGASAPQQIAVLVREIRTRALAFGLNWDDILTAADYDNQENKNEARGQVHGRDS